MESKSVLILLFVIFASVNCHKYHDIHQLHQVYHLPQIHEVDVTHEVHEVSHSCPYRNVFYPCTCSLVTSDNVNYKTQITCRGINGQQIKEIFHNAYHSNVSRHYDIIEINDVPLLNICCEDIFSGFHFKSIKIINSKICVINVDGFLNTEHYTTELMILNSQFTPNLVDGQQLFRIIRRLKNLKGLYIISSNLEQIPHDAFKGGHFGHDLQVIRICNSRISRIPDYTFLGLPKLIWIDFGDNYINHINSRTFEMKSSTNKPIEISLSANRLTSPGIEQGSFSGIHRQKVEIYITDNQLDTLHEHVFNPLLRTENTELHVDHNPFICDCRHRWLFNHLEDNQYHLKGMTCKEDGRPIWTKNLSHCSEKIIEPPSGVDIFRKCCRRHADHNHQIEKK